MSVVIQKMVTYKTQKDFLVNLENGNFDPMLQLFDDDGNLSDNSKNMCLPYSFKGNDGNPEKNIKISKEMWHFIL